MHWQPASEQHKGNYMNFIKNFIKDEDGVTAIEYALLAAVIAVVMLVGAKLLGTGLSTSFTNLANKIKIT
jgi:pilus assembly protein Flp/PilA